MIFPGLVKTTSVILLQAVPSRVSLNDMTNDLLQVTSAARTGCIDGSNITTYSIQLDDVLSVHEVHVWQLSDTKLIASLHMRLRTYANYMEVATNVRRLLHRYGIHSATIQPEFSSSSLHDSKQQLTHESEKGNIEFSSSSAGAFNAPSIASNSLTEDNNVRETQQWQQLAVCWCTFLTTLLRRNVPAIMSQIVFCDAWKTRAHKTHAALNNNRPRHSVLLHHADRRNAICTL